MKQPKSNISGIAFDINDPQEPPAPDTLSKKGEKTKKGGLQVAYTRPIIFFKPQIFIDSFNLSFIEYFVQLLVS